MLQTVFIYLKHHEVINSFQKTNMHNKMKRWNLSDGGILFISPTGYFDET